METNGDLGIHDLRKPHIDIVNMMNHHQPLINHLRTINQPWFIIVQG